METGLQDNNLPAAQPKHQEKTGLIERNMSGVFHWLSIVAFIFAEFNRDIDFNDTGQATQHIPRTGGVIGFIDQHIGSSMETLEVYMASRVALGLLSKAGEIMTDKKIPARVQVATATLVGVLIPSLYEFGVLENANQVADPLDVFGPVLAGIFAYSSYEATQRLFGNKPVSPEVAAENFQVS